MIRVKVINSDGGWQYLQVAELMPYIFLACMPLLKASMIHEDREMTMTPKKRRYVLYGRNENGIYCYREDIS